MTEAGDIHLADLNDERRWQVLVVSSRRFNAASGRVLVAPEVSSVPGEVLAPWRISIDGSVYALDLLRSLPTERLLDRLGRAPASAMSLVQRAVANIT